MQRSLDADRARASPASGFALRQAPLAHLDTSTLRLNAAANLFNRSADGADQRDVKTPEKCQHVATHG